MTGFWYMASPYTRYKGGKHEEAFRLASEAAGFLLDNRIPTFSPIAHSHPIAVHSAAPAVDLAYWLRVDEPILEAAVGVIVLQIEGWDESTGVAHEIALAHKLGKPVIYLPWENADE